MIQQMASFARGHLTGASLAAFTAFAALPCLLPLGVAAGTSAAAAQGQPASGIAADGIAQEKTYGASVPFVTLEAESAQNRTDGRLVKFEGMPKRLDSPPELWASGKAYVELSRTGQYIDFPVEQAANTIVVRSVLPDAPEGGGITGTLSLYVNGQKRKAIELSSKHTWLYAGDSPNVPNTDGPVRNYWDEAHFFIPGGVQAGDVLRLQKDATDDAAYYGIDCIDLEQVADPLAPPAAGTFLSVLDYGALGDGVTDDSDAIERCIAAARAARKTVWIPQGRYITSRSFLLDGVRVQGAGMWYTQIIGVTDGQVIDTWAGHTGFVLSGSGAQVRDLFIETPNYTWRSRSGAKPIIGRNQPTDWLVENLWIVHTNTGLWMSRTHRGVVRGCRIRSTYADGININNGSTDVLVENNHLRGNGDDGLAILSETPHPLTTGVILRDNTVIATWWGANCDIAGGYGHLIENNLLEDGAGLIANLPKSYPMNPLSGSVIRGNKIVRAGNNLFSGQRRGAVWIYPGNTSIENLLVKDNLIVEPIFRGIHMTGTERQDVVFEGNRIERPGENAVFVEKQVVGSGVFLGNVVSGLREGVSALRNEAADSYHVTDFDNQW